MTEEHVAPLVPADCDLRDFPYMPLDVARLRDSDLASDETPEACWAAVLLWCASWHQVPAASIPDSDQWLAKQAGYVSRGRIDSTWSKVREGALRGWIKCSDGRLYHPVVAEKALDAWNAKLQQRWKTEVARIKQHNQRHGTNIIIADFETWLSIGCPQGQALFVPEDNTPNSPGTNPECPQGQPPSVPRETHSKRSEEREKLTSFSVSSVSGGSETPCPPTPENATRTGSLCKELRKIGVDAAPHLAAWSEILPGYSDEEILGAARAAKDKKPDERLHLNYLVPILKDRAIPKAKDREPPWWSSEKLMLEKGRTLGLEPRPGEDWPAFRGRINEKLSAEVPA